MSFSTVLALFVGIPFALAAVIALAMYLPSWMGRSRDVDSARGNVITSVGAAPDPTVMPNQLASADWTTTAGGGSSSWSTNTADFVLTASGRQNLVSLVERARVIGGQQFSVAFGSLSEGRTTALVQHGLLATPQSAVSVFVDPVLARVEIVTGRIARIHVDDRTADLAALALRSGAEVGDLMRGISDCVNLLAEHARAPRVMHLGEPA